MAKKKQDPPQDVAALADEVAEMEALLKRRKKLQTMLADDEGAGAGADAPLPGAELIEQVMSDLGGDGSFSIVKLEGGRPLNMGTHDLTLWPDAMEELVRVQGGGNYVLIFRRPDGTIAKRIQRTYPASLYPAPAEKATSGSGDMLAMLKMMEERDARREAQNETLRLEAMKGQQAMMTAMLTMMGSKDKPLINNAAELATIAKLFGDNKKGTDLSDLVALKDLLDDLRGDREDEGVKIETDSPIVALLAPLLQAVSKGMAPRAAAPRPVPANPAPPAAVPALMAKAEPPSAPPTAVASPAAEAGRLTQFIPSLKAAIGSGVSAEVAANFAWDKAVEDNKTDYLAELLESGDWGVLDADAYLKEHSAWIGAFRARLETLAFEPEPEVTAPAPEHLPEPEADAVH